jgi:DNA-binding transcriptional ArsR family regulator
MVNQIPLGPALGGRRGLQGGHAMSEFVGDPGLHDGDGGTTLAPEVRAAMRLAQRHPELSLEELLGKVSRRYDVGRLRRRFANAKRHELRIQLVSHIRGAGPTNPAAAAGALEKDLGVTSYHFRSLLAAGLVKRVGTAQRRGAVAHFHAVTELGVIWLASALTDGPPTVPAQFAAIVRDPLRKELLLIIAEIDGDGTSPRQLSEHPATEGRSLSVVSYHVRTLAQSGLLDLVRRRQRRGAVEHFYRVSAEGAKLVETISRQEG